jgi:hypothetical protein
MNLLPFVFSFLFLAQNQWSDSSHKDLQHRIIAPDPVPICEVDAITIPFKRAGRLLIIEAQVDSHRGNFIFDTGALT